MSRRSTADRWTVIMWHKEGLTVSDIARKTKFDRHFIYRWIKKYEAGEPIEEGKRTGRPRKRIPRVEAAIERTIRGKRRRSSRVVARDLKRQKIADISRMTVQRAAHNRGLHPFKQRKTSRLTKKQKEQRLKFAQANSKKDWSVVVFSDEHKFKQFKGGNPAHNVVWAKSVSEVPVKEVERWGLTLDAWAGISSTGKTKLVTYEGTLDAKSYQDVVEEALLPAAMEWFEDEKDGWELQQDKATCHTAKSTQSFLEAKGIAVLEGWPTKGDDINVMENLWAILDEKLEQKKFTSRQGMKKAVTAIWNDIDEDLLNKLIASVPNRLRKIVKAQGGSIKTVRQ